MRPGYSQAGTCTAFGRATGRQAIAELVVQNSPHGPEVGSGGAYADELVNQSGHWLFCYRKIDRFIPHERNAGRDD